MTNLEMAKRMWDAYADQGGGKTYDGRPLHTWKELGAERQSCWLAAASVASARIEKLEAALRGVIAIADRDCPEFRFARKALEEIDGK